VINHGLFGHLTATRLPTFGQCLLLDAFLGGRPARKQGYKDDETGERLAREGQPTDQYYHDERAEQPHEHAPPSPRVEGTEERRGEAGGDGYGSEAAKSGPPAARAAEVGVTPARHGHLCILDAELIVAGQPAVTLPAVAAGRGLTAAIAVVCPAPDGVRCAQRLGVDDPGRGHRVCPFTGSVELGC